MFLHDLFESSLRDLEDYNAKRKALQDIQMDPNTSNDPELQDELVRRLASLEKEAQAKGLANEAKQRLDPKCWTGYKKQGTKMKGGVRVNNCVPAESIEEENKGLYYNVNKRKKAGISRDKDHPKAPTAQAWKDAAKTAKKESVVKGNFSDNNEPENEGILHTKYKRNRFKSLDQRKSKEEKLLQKAMRRVKDQEDEDPVYEAGAGSMTVGMKSNHKAFKVTQEEIDFVAETMDYEGYEFVEQVNEKEEHATIKGPHGRLNVDRSRPGITRVTRKDYDDTGPYNPGVGKGGRGIDKGAGHHGLPGGVNVAGNDSTEFSDPRTDYAARRRRPSNSDDWDANFRRDID